jgi:hypothetical protein
MELEDALKANPEQDDIIQQHTHSLIFFLILSSHIWI